MKKIITYSFILVLTFISCDQSADIKPSENEPNLPPVYDTVGEIHNEILDYLHAELTEKPGRFHSIQEYKRFLQEKTAHWLSANSHDDALAYYRKLDIDVLEGSNFIKPEPRDNAEKRNTLSAPFYRLLEKAHSVVPDRRTAIRKAHKIAFSELKDKAAEKLTREEYALFTMTVSTLEHSSEYWMDDSNAEKWINVLTSKLPADVLENNNPTIADRIRASGNPCYWNPLCLLIDWEEVAIKDGGGVLVGAISMGIKWVAASTPPGAATIAVAIASSAVGASAGEIYDQLTELL